jgi:hypothetical protein
VAMRVSGPAICFIDPEPSKMNSTLFCAMAVDAISRAAAAASG